MRIDLRNSHELRPVHFVTRFIEHHPGSVLVSFGKTRVLTTATWENRVPLHCQATGSGWLTAEYSMLPASTPERKQRTTQKGMVDGRSVEIQRLIGRSLRQAINLNAIANKTICVDCDVLQADGGTRTAAITGAWISLVLCARELVARNEVRNKTLQQIIPAQLAAVSLGVVDGEVWTDLSYEEDVRCQTDFNVVALRDGRIVEFQGSAEKSPMTSNDVSKILQFGTNAIKELCDLQIQALTHAGADIGYLIAH